MRHNFALWSLLRLLSISVIVIFFITSVSTPKWISEPFTVEKMEHSNIELSLILFPDLLHISPIINQTHILIGYRNRIHNVPINVNITQETKIDNLIITIQQGIAIFVKIIGNDNIIQISDYNINNGCFNIDMKPHPIHTQPSTPSILFNQSLSSYDGELFRLIANQPCSLSLTSKQLTLRHLKLNHSYQISVPFQEILEWHPVNLIHGYVITDENLVYSYSFHTQKFELREDVPGTPEFFFDSFVVTSIHNKHRLYHLKKNILSPQIFSTKIHSILKPDLYIDTNFRLHTNQHLLTVPNINSSSVLTWISSSDNTWKIVNFEQIHFHTSTYIVLLDRSNQNPQLTFLSFLSSPASSVTKIPNSQPTVSLSIDYNGLVLANTHRNHMSTSFIDDTDTVFVRTDDIPYLSFHQIDTNRGFISDGPPSENCRYLTVRTNNLITWSPFPSSTYSVWTIQPPIDSNHPNMRSILSEFNQSFLSLCETSSLCLRKDPLLFNVSFS